MSFNSTERIVEMIVGLGKEDVLYEEAGVSKLFKRPKVVQISPSFFRGYICKQCGWCCQIVSLDYYCSTLWSMLREYPSYIPPLLRPVKICINRQEKEIFRVANTGAVCAFQFPTNKKPVFCRVHRQSPWGCRFELYKVRRIKDAGVLTLTYPARKWIVRKGTTAQCEIVNHLQSSYEESIGYLVELGMIAAELEIRSWIPEILKTLRAIKCPDFPKEKIIVGTNGE